MPATLDPETSASERDAEIASIRAKLAFREELRTHVRDSIALVNLGLTSPAEVTTALSHRGVSLLAPDQVSNFKPAPDLGAINRALTLLISDGKRRGVEAMKFVEHARARDAQERGLAGDAPIHDAYTGIIVGYKNRITKTYQGVMNLIEGLGVGALAGALHNFAPESFASPEVRARHHTETSAQVYELFGLPPDPLTREKFIQDFPWTARMVGDIAALMSITRVIPPLELLLPGAARLIGPGAVVATTNFLEGVPLSGRAAVAFRTSLLGGGAVLGAMTAPEGSDPYTIAEHAIAGGVGLAILPSMFRSQPRGVLARAIFETERKGAFGAGERLAAALSYSPRLTIGHTLNVIAQGAALGAANAAAEGRPPGAAIEQGVVEGLNWVAGDLLATRAAGLGRYFGATNTALAKHSARWLQDLGLNAENAIGLAHVSKAALPTAGGAGIGAILAGILGGNVQQGALGGAVFGALGGFAGRRLESVLDQATFEKLRTQNLAALKPIEVARITEAVLHGAATDAMTYDAPDAALPMLVREMLGNGPRLTATEVELSTRLARVYQQLDAILGPAEELPATSEGVKEVLKLGTQAMAMREQLAKVVAERATRGVHPIEIGELTTLTERMATAKTVHVERIRAEVEAENFALAAEAAEERAAKAAAKLARAPKGDAPVVLASGLTDPFAGPTTASTLSSPSDLHAAGVISESRTNVPRGTGVAVSQSEIDLAKALDASARKRAESAAAARLASERGSVGVGPLVTTVLGGFAGAYVGRQLQDPTHDPAYAGVAIGALVGGFTAPLVLAAASKMLLKPEAAKLVRLMTVPESETIYEAAYKAAAKTLPEALAQAHATAKVRGYIGSAATTKRDFFRLPVEAQVEHAAARIRASLEIDRAPKSYPANVTSKTAEAAHRAELRRAELVKVVRRFIPTHLTPDTFDIYTDAIRAAAKKAGFDPARTELLVRGALKEMTLPYVRRVFPQDGDLFATASSARNPFGTAKSFDDLRRAVLAAQTLTGPAMPEHRTAATFGRRNIRAGFTPDAVWADTLAVSQQSGVSVDGVAGVEHVSRGPFIAAILPPERLRSIAESLISKGDAAGTEVLRFFTSVMSSTSNFESSLASHAGELNSIFHGFTTEQRKAVRGLLEDKKALAASATTWRAGFNAATEFRGLLNKVADALGMPRQERLEDYYPWIYSQRTIRRLISEGRIGEDMFVPWNARIPAYKIMQNALTRFNETPLGETLDDPLEAGMIYLYGGLRKLHLDPIANEFDGAWFKKLASTQPFIASHSADWMLDLFGIPRGYTLKAMTWLHGIGLNLESIASRMPGLGESAFFQEFVDRYFLNAGALGSITRAIRGLEFYSKLGGITTSALVNFGQLWVNAGADLPISSILIGGSDFLAKTAYGKALEGINRIVPLPEPWLRGTAKLQFAREYGVYKEATRKDLDMIANTIASTRGRGLGVTLAAGAAGASIGANVDDNDPLVGAALGASAGFAAAAIAPKLVRFSLLAPLRASTFLFEGIEVINRGATAGAALREVKQAKRYAAGGVPRALVSGEQFLESTLTFAGSGALTAGAFANDQDITTADGAAIGAVLGAGAGILGRSRAAATVGSIARMRALGPFIPGFQREGLAALSALTLDDAERWYVRQVLDMTQFRFGREAKPQWLRTPAGEILGALQNFTFNQIEFVGSRWESFLESARVARESAGGGFSGALSAYGGGKLDLRFFRHIALLFGMAGALTQLSGAGGVEREFSYWLSRLGFGFLPLLHYNESARKWQLADIGQQATGPVIHDIYKGYQAVSRFMFDPEATESFVEQSNELARGIFTGLTQTESAPKAIGASLDKLGAEGLADTVRSLGPAASALANPAYTATGQTPPRRVRRD